MIKPRNFAQRQMELAVEFAKFVRDHPEIDERLPEDAYVYFEVDGEARYNRYSRQLAERRQAEGMAIVCVHVKGLAPPLGSRLIEPTIKSSPAMA